jgi:hypothetical protein
MAQRKPQFRSLSERQCRALLRRAHVGRVAFTFKDRVDIEPISYLSDGDWLYCRTQAGTKLVQMRHNPWVAFEVDEVDGPFDWKSAVVRGTAYFLGTEHPDFAKAVRRLRRLDPRIFTPDDPVPARTIVFRIHINEMTGRSASTGAAT